MYLYLPLHISCLPRGQRGVSPFKNNFPLSFEGEGDKGGEVDKQISNAMRLTCVNQQKVAIFVSSRYNFSRAEVAQSVEQRTENPRVPSSILGLGTTPGRK